MYTRRQEDGAASLLGEKGQLELEAQVSFLQEELARSKEEAQKWKAAHSNLTKAVAESTKVKPKR